MNWLYYWTFIFLRRGLQLKRILPAPARRLAFMVALYDFTFALSTTFLNVYLFRGGDWNVVSHYNGAAFCVIPMAFVLGGIWGKKSGFRRPYQMGLILHAALFAGTLFLGTCAADHAHGLGFLGGAAIGFYYLGQHAMTFRAVRESFRDTFFSLYVFLSSVLRVLAPAAAGVLVGALAGGEILGYRILFAVTLVIYVFLIFWSRKLPQAVLRGERYFLKESLRMHWEKRLRPVFWVYGFWGLRNGVFFFLLGVLVYQSTKSELAVGTYSSMGNLSGVAAAWALSKVLTRKNRGNFLGYSSWLDFLSVGLLVWKITPVTLFFFTLCYSTANTGFRVTFNAFSFELMEKTRKEKKNMEFEHLAVREFPLNAGRLLGLMLFLWGGRFFGDLGMRIALFFLGAGHIAIWWMLTHTLRSAWEAPLKQPLHDF